MFRVCAEPFAWNILSLGGANDIFFCPNEADKPSLHLCHDPRINNNRETHESKAFVEKNTKTPFFLFLVVWPPSEQTTLFLIHASMWLGLRRVDRDFPPTLPPPLTPIPLALCRICDDAIGWCIDVLDISGELTQYLLPDPPPDDAGVDWTASSGDANLWHRVIVIGRPGASSPGGGGSTGHDDASAERQEKREGGMAGAGSGTSSSVFVVEFENGRTTRLDLSQIAIRWLHFCDAGGSGGSGGGVQDGREHQQQQQHTRTPPGFGVRGGDGLAYDGTDVGTRVDVWWPRYNSYFRATVSISFSEGGWKPPRRSREGSRYVRSVSEEGFVFSEGLGPFLRHPGMFSPRWLVASTSGTDWWTRERSVPSLLRVARGWARTSARYSTASPLFRSASKSTPHIPLYHGAPVFGPVATTLLARYFVPSPASLAFPFFSELKA